MTPTALVKVQSFPNFCWKAKKLYEVDTDAIPDQVFREALMLGIRELLNRGMSALHNERLDVYDAKAKENIDKIMTGAIRYSGKLSSN